MKHFLILFLFTVVSSAGFAAVNCEENKLYPERAKACQLGVGFAKAHPFQLATEECRNAYPPKGIGDFYADIEKAIHESKSKKDKIAEVHEYYYHRYRAQQELNHCVLGVMRQKSSGLALSKEPDPGFSGQKLATLPERHAYELGVAFMKFLGFESAKEQCKEWYPAPSLSETYLAYTRVADPINKDKEVVNFHSWYLNNLWGWWGACLSGAITQSMQADSQ